MRNRLLLVLILLLTMAVACGGSDSGPAGEPEAVAGAEAAKDLPTRAAEITLAVEADPDSADAILEQHGVTVDEFEEMMFEIAADPELTRAYEAALAR
jgi:hypothetical protein